MAAGLLNEDGVREIDEQVQREVDEAVRFADESPDPPLEGLFDYMYAPDDAGLKGSQHDTPTANSTKGSQGTEVKGEE
jgi:pyruvate dehydrogenase E1 component alpha subunit